MKLFKKKSVILIFLFLVLVCHSHKLNISFMYCKVYRLLDTFFYNVCPVNSNISSNS